MTILRSQSVDSALWINQLHFLLRIDVEQSSQWSAMEVARLWMALLVDYTSRLVRDGKAAVTAEVDSILRGLAVVLGVGAPGC